jgi:eukaryotic-like serine/threonine-protein kinase
MLAFLSGSTATDQAAQAARYALALFQMRPELRIGVATGRAETTKSGLVGQSIDRAAALASDAANRWPGILLDDLTASLLGPHFETAKAGAHFALLSERGGIEVPRLLMGKPMPCVGREKELGTLELTLDECVRDRVAHAVLVTAAPGVGKSRLASEFVARWCSRVSSAWTPLPGASCALRARTESDAGRAQWLHSSGTTPIPDPGSSSWPIGRSW